MKRLLGIFTMLLFAVQAYSQTATMQQDLFANMTPDDKAVVVAVHFGTTNTEARKQALDNFNIRLQAEYPECDFREAWTSRTITNLLSSRGDIMFTPVQLLRELRELGYTHILIQPSFITDGVEMQNLRAEVQAMKRHFKHIRLGQPLLTSTRDFEMSILATAAAYGDEKTANVLVCHGSEGALNSHYTMIDYMLRDKGMDNWYVVTIDGYPGMESLTKALKANKEKKVNLIPFLFLKGKHFTTDIAVNMKKQLQQGGYKVEVVPHSLGEADEILDIYMDHAKFASKYRTLTPSEVKFMESVVQP